MTDSEIIGNIATECGELPPNQETIEHQPGCMCECCCQISEANGHDNLSTCEPLPTPTTRKKMKNKLMPTLANCAVLLIGIGFATIGQAAGEIDRLIGAIQAKPIAIDGAGITVPTARGVVDNFDPNAISANISDGTNIEIGASRLIIQPAIDVRRQATRSSRKFIRIDAT